MKYTASEIEELEVHMLLSVIEEVYGYDFKDYSRASLKRRLLKQVKENNLNHISQLLPKVLHEPFFFSKLVEQISVTVTQMFRDPEFFLALKKTVFDRLRTYPFINIWHAGCATGEEVYSMAIMLKEEGLYDRAHIYATDINSTSLEIAKKGLYELENFKQFVKNYIEAEGKNSFSDYYTATEKYVELSDSLKKNLTFTQHNLVTDGCFGEMNLIICRNVLIYFNNRLQNRVQELFYKSLTHRGFLALGTKETLDFTAVADKYSTLDSTFRIYQKLAEVADEKSTQQANGAQSGASL